MATEQSTRTYEVGFSTERFQHIFYISCTEDVDAKSFAHAVFHYYDTPEEWGRKLCISAIAAIKPGNCIPDFLHIGLQDMAVIPMADESEASHHEVRNVIRKFIGAGCVPMAIYDGEKKTMTVYGTKKLEVAPKNEAASVVMNFSNFGGIPGLKK